MMNMGIYQLKSVTLYKYLHRCASFHQSIYCHMLGSFIKGSTLRIQCVNEIELQPAIFPLFKHVIRFHELPARPWLIGV